MEETRTSYFDALLHLETLYGVRCAQLGEDVLMARPHLLACAPVVLAPACGDRRAAATPFSSVAGERRRGRYDANATAASTPAAAAGVSDVCSRRTRRR